MKVTVKKLVVACTLLTSGIPNIQALSVTEYINEQGLPKIGRALNFSNAGLTTLDGLDAVLLNAQHWLRSLQSLNLSGNNLTHIPAGVFDNATQLRELDLSNNRISRLPHNIFTNLPNLRELNIVNNPFEPTYIPEFTAMIRNLPNLQVLNGQPVNEALERLRSQPAPLRDQAIDYVMPNIQPEQFEQLARVLPAIFDLLPLPADQRKAILDKIAAEGAAQQTTQS